MKMKMSEVIMGQSEDVRKRRSIGLWAIVDRDFVNDVITRTKSIDKAYAAVQIRKEWFKRIKEVNNYYQKEIEKVLDD